MWIMTRKQRTVRMIVLEISERTKFRIKNKVRVKIGVQISKSQRRMERNKITMVTALETLVKKHKKF